MLNFYYFANLVKEAGENDAALIFLLASFKMQCVLAVFCYELDCPFVRDQLSIFNAHHFDLEDFLAHQSSLNEFLDLKRLLPTFGIHGNIYLI